MTATGRGTAKASRNSMVPLSIQASMRRSQVASMSGRSALTIRGVNARETSRR